MYIRGGSSNWLDMSLFIFIIRSLSLCCVLGGVITGTMLASDGEVLKVLFVRDGGKASLAAT